jgi:hypothetical protein
MSTMVTTTVRRVCVCACAGCRVCVCLAAPVASCLCVWLCSGRLVCVCVRSGHDFAHWRNWAEIRQDRLAKRGGWGISKSQTKSAEPLPPSYGVGQVRAPLTPCDPTLMPRGRCVRPSPHGTPP